MIARPCCASPHSLRVKTVCRSEFAQQLLPLDSELPDNYTVSDYDGDEKVQARAVHPLSMNKYRLRQAFNVSGGTACWPYR